MNYAGYNIDDDCAPLKELRYYPIIGLTGHIGSGKTTAAMHLCERHGFVRHRFAGPLKSMLHRLGLSQEHTDGPLKELPCELLGGKTPRHAMQTLGTEWGRDCIVPDLWIRAWKATLPTGFPIVVDDVRFANEADAIHDVGGITIRIDRPRPISLLDFHQSEDMEFYTHWRVVNDASVELMNATIGNIALDMLSGLSD